MYGTVRELEGRLTGDGLLDRLASGESMPLPKERPDLLGYLQLALAGGFPEPTLQLSETARVIWLESYIDQVVTRDAPATDPGRDPARLRTVIYWTASWTLSWRANCVPRCR